MDPSFVYYFIAFLLTFWLLLRIIITFDFNLYIFLLTNSKCISFTMNAKLPFLNSVLANIQSEILWCKCFFLFVYIKLYSNNQHQQQIPQQHTAPTSPRDESQQQQQNENTHRNLPSPAAAHPQSANANQDMDEDVAINQVCCLFFFCSKIETGGAFLSLSREEKKSQT